MSDMVYKCVGYLTGIYESGETVYVEDIIKSTSRFGRIYIQFEDYEKPKIGIIPSTVDSNV